MKKFFLTMLGVSAMLCSTSCSDESIAPASEGEAMAQFTVELTDGSDASRAVSDGLKVTELYYEVYTNVNGTQTLMENETLDAVTTLDKKVVDGKEVRTATVNLALVKGQAYDVVFWAQAEGAYVKDVANKLTEIAIPATTANNEAKDAFTAVYRTSKVTGPIKETIKLTRPFAQVNFGTLDVEAAKKAGITFSESRVTVSNAANMYNALTETASATGAEQIFEWADLHNMAEEALVVGESTYEYLATAYVLVPGDKTQKLSDLKMEIRTGLNEIITLSVPNAPVQRNYRTNVLGNLLTNTAEFNVVVDPIYNEPDKVIVEKDVNTDEDLEAALRQNEEHIVVNLGDKGRAAKSEYVVNISSHVAKYYFGGEKTKTITINGNGHKINFKQNDSDWNYIRCVNDAAKWVINNVELTNSGYNGGHWSRMGIAFHNEVDFKNVTSDKGIIVYNNALLENVKITEEREAYSLWISAEGQSVTVKNSVFTALNGGRGIAIKDENVKETLAKVKLTVENSTFKTAKKAAILVTSPAGAEIVLNSNDISGVKADGLNAVWVDEKYADYAGAVTVEGGSVIVEPDEATVSPFEIEGNTVELSAGTYTFPSKVAKGVTIKCEEGVVFSGTSGLNINGATVEGATFSNPSGNAVGGTINGSFKNCTFTGSNALRYCYTSETTVFEDCVFDGSTYGVHFDGGSNPVTFKRCTFSGFNAFAAKIELLTIEDCTFKCTGKSGYNGANLWGVTKLINTKFEFDGKASTEWIGLNAVQSGKKIELVNCEVPEGKTLFEYFANYNSGNKVTVDGVEYVLVYDAKGLTSALSGDVKNIYLAEGEVLEGTFNVNSEKTLFSAASNKATIKGRVNVSSTGTGSFENIKFDINDESKAKYAFGGTNYQYPAIVVIYAAATKFEGCEFKTDLATGVCGVNYGAHSAGKMLEINNCKFEGDFYGIRSRTLFSVTNSIFNTYTSAGTLAAVFTWGNGDSGADSVTFTGNTNTSGYETMGVMLSSTTFTYDNIHFNVQGNSNFTKFSDSINPACSVTGSTFAEGSETF